MVRLTSAPGRDGVRHSLRRSLLLHLAPPEAKEPLDPRAWLDLIRKQETARY